MHKTIPSTSNVEGELSNGDGHPVDTEIAQTENTRSWAQVGTMKIVIFQVWELTICYNTNPGFVNPWPIVEDCWIVGHLPLTHEGDKTYHCEFFPCP